MDVKVLIDNIVRQTTVLIAQLATSAGIRAPLAHIANEVFLNLVRELEAHGVSRKVAADMFGLALRSYQQKIRRLEESVTQRDTSLWEAILDLIRERGPITRSQIGQRFKYDEERVIAAILRDQVESGLIYCSGQGPGTRYRMTSEDELRQAMESDSTSATEALVWISAHRDGPISAAQLAANLGLDEGTVVETLERLAQDGRLEALDTNGARTYRCPTCVLPLGSSIGWEAAVYDHYASLVQAIAAKLSQGKTCAFADDVLGGSTYSFEIWSGHPFEESVLALLREYRAELSKLREAVERHNQRQGIPSEGYTEVVFYLGQSVRHRDWNSAPTQEP